MQSWNFIKITVGYIVTLVAEGVQRWHGDKSFCVPMPGERLIDTHNPDYAVRVLFVNFKSKLHARRTVCAEEA